MESEKFLPFLEKKVAVEIPTWNNNNRTFAYFGVVKEVYNDSLILERGNGRKTLLKFEQILEIREESQ